MSEENLIFTGLTKVIDPAELGLQPGTGDGFIRCISVEEKAPPTTWTGEGDSRAQPMDEDVRWPAGSVNISFATTAGHTAPPPLTGVQVRPGLGTIILVDYNPPGSSLP